MILNGVALEGRIGKECEKLREIGMEIAKKCDGLPLAARSAGRMLSSRSSELQWRAVLEDSLWKDEDKPSDLFRLLNLSYTDLSPLLKRCLLSSVVFPKGTTLSVDEISRVWMAYGYLNFNGSVGEEKLKGLQYFNNLAFRSFFERASIEGGDDVNEEYTRYLLQDAMPYTMHDIMHDFAVYLLGSDEYSFIMNGGLEKEKSSFSKRGPDYNSLGRFRTYSVCREELQPNIVSHLTRVRVLSMRDCNLEGLPQDIGKLIHLRYLNVSDNPITELPQTITGLCNLQTLNIDRCESLSSLHEGIEKLINLRHLLNAETSKLVEYPQGLEKLSGLQTLSEFRGSRKLGCLGNMNQLQGEICILFLHGFDVEEFGDPKLWEKQHIEKLRLCFYEVEKSDAMVEALKPPPNLLSLDTSSCSGKWLSRWITSFDNLKVVSFHGGEECSNVPPFFKLPALEELEIEECRFERLGIGFLGLEDASRQVVGGFPRLKKLRFSCCFDWEEWEDIEEEESVPVLPSLEELEFSHCWDIKELPLTLLGKAASLRLVKVSSCRILSERYDKVSGFDRHNIPLLPNLMWNFD